MTFPCDMVDMVMVDRHGGHGHGGRGHGELEIW